MGISNSALKKITEMDENEEEIVSRDYSFDGVNLTEEEEGEENDL
jgi:hypothetical protein